MPPKQQLLRRFIGTASRERGAGSTHLSGVRPSVCLSVPANFAAAARPAGDSDRLLHGAQQRGVRMRVVPRCQRTYIVVTELSVLHRSTTDSRVVSVLDSGAEGPGFKSQPRRSRVTVLGKLFTPHTHRASVHQLEKLVAALLRVAGVTAGLAESNGSLPSGL